MDLTAGGRTDSGPRPQNEDWLHWDLDLGLLVVVDGMGGHNAGEVAAHLAVETVARFLAESRDWADLTWPFGFDPSMSGAGNRLLTAVRLANRRIWSEGNTHEAFRGMGTTIVAGLVDGDRLTLVSVGDSRIYRWRAGALEQLTEDDTWLSAMIQAGVDPASLAGRHPMRHVLTAVVGASEELTAGVREERLEPGDRVLLCTDGVHGFLGASDIAARLGGPGTADALATTVVAGALGAGTADNATALVLVCR